MSKEINIGDYVRTKNGLIGKIKKIDNEMDLEDLYLIKTKWYYKKYIVKSSPNIIDLIEVGDYVNGLYVEKNKYDELYTSYVYYGGDIGKQCEVYTTWLKDYKEDEIYSIVTKEQFERNEYKICK